VAAALLAALPCVEAGLSLWNGSGPQTFGRPPLLGPLLWLAALGLAVWFATAADRSALARRMVLVAVGLALFGGSVVPALPGLSAAYCGATLFVAAPWIRLAALGWATIGLLLLSLPACLGTSFPGGVPTWLIAMAPHVTVALTLPGLLPGSGARRAAQVVLGVTAMVCLAGVISYPLLASGLDLPLGPLMATRLRLLGHHPNLVVPGLVLATLLAAALVLRPGARWERLACLPLLAATAMVGSRTAWLAIVAGLILLVALRRLPRHATILRGLAGAVVLATLLVPTLGWTDSSITHESSAAVTKAVTFRASMWRLGRASFAAAPWNGYGPGTTFMQNQHVEPGRYDVLAGDDHPHNTTLAVGAAFGWPGLLALAWLLVVSLRRYGNSSLLGDSAQAALFVTWAANGIDLGGATSSLFPSSAFLLAAISAAAAADAGGPNDPSTDGSPAVARRAQLAHRAWMLLGALVVVFGLGRASALATLRDVSDRLASAPPEGLAQDDADELDSRVARAGHWLPGDHRVPLMRSNLAGRDLDRAVDHLEQARSLAPGLARVAHLQALTLSRRNPDDPRVRELLNEAERLAPFGPDAWRQHMDQAALAAHHGQADVAFAKFLDALRLTPGAVTRARWDARRGMLHLSAGGATGLDVPLDDLLDALEREADQLAESDAAYTIRLRLAVTRVLTALGEHDRADAAAQRLFTEQPDYALHQRRASALARGDHDAVLALHRDSGPALGFQTTVEVLLAHAFASRQDAVGYEQALDTVMSWVPDVLFELPTVVLLLRARREWAERTGDLAAVRRLDRALAWAGS
jgi:O-antigen ligase